MKVALVNLTNGGLSGGSRKYLQHLVPLLKQHADISELQVFVPPQASDVKIEGVSPRTWPERDVVKGFQNLKLSLQEMSPDIVFFPTARWLNCGTIPTVVMVRNMEPLALPFGGNRLPESFKNIARAYTARKACQRATHVVAVSNFVGDFLVNKWSLPPDKVGVVYHGVESPINLDQLRRPEALSHDDCDPFIFTAGSIRPARGLEDAISAMSMVKSQGRSHRLVIAGHIEPGMGFYKKKLERLASKADVLDRVIWADFLSAEEMPWCYKNAAFFVMTSRVEACPNIALEAMANGCLTVSTENPPMPEFFKDAALYYQSGRAEDLGRKMLDILGMTESQKDKYIQRAKRSIEEFSWQNTATKTVDELKRAVGENN